MNFYQILRDLDHQIVGDGLCSVPTGRAYVGANGPYGDKIHTFPFSEKLRPLESRRSGGLYMGTAGLINFGHLRDIKPDHAILFDVNPFQIIFWNVVLSAIRYNEELDGFCQVVNYAEHITRRIVSQKLKGIEFSSTGSWTQALSRDNGMSISRMDFTTSAVPMASYFDSIDFSPEDYRLIKSMVDNGRIGTITLDIFDRPAWVQLGDALHAMATIESNVSGKIDVLYLSSVLKFASGETDWTGRRLQNANIHGFSSLLHKESTIIDNRGHYSSAEFHDILKEERPWLSLPRMPNLKESVQAFGVDKLVPRFT